jgi:hypothetical protein
MTDDNRDRFHEILLHILQQARAEAALDPAYLSLALFRIDAAHYRRTGSVISGGTYVRGSRGPSFERLAAVLDDMVRQGLLAAEPLPNGAGSGHRHLTPLRAANLASLTAQERATLEQVNATSSAPAATALDSLARDLPGVLAVREGERIPFGVALVAKPSLSPEEVAFGLTLSDALVARRER